MKSFADPLPKPSVFSHADVYPNFTVWGWEAGSNRRQPGITVLENVSASGFRSAVREWIPGGATIASVKLSITSAPRLYPASSQQTVTYVRLRDGKLRRANQRADAQGRLNFELDGDEYEVAVGAGPRVTIAGYKIEDAAWATAGRPVRLRVKFLNNGAARSTTELLKWESPNPGVTVDPASGRTFSLAPGETGDLAVKVMAADPQRMVVRLVAVLGGVRLPLVVPLYPPAETSEDFRIADGRPWDLYQHGTTHSEETLGDGNGDGHASPGETFAVLLPDGEAWRAAELFTNDACVDNTIRVSDSWSDYDHTGASVKYSLPRIRSDCAPGTRLHMLARVVMPNAPQHQVRYWALEIPVWYAITEAGH
jgi:hypothetical protein